MILVLFYSCESFTEDEVICLPVNMTATIVQGTETKKIIADFHYMSESNRLDHITWSNHQTHYFEYDDLDRIMVMRQMKVDIKLQEEKWFNYDGSRIEKINLVKRNLDRTYLEPLDSIYVGYVDFEYEGGNIIGERRYELSENGKKLELVWRVYYEYDASGNITGSNASDPRSQSAESVRMTYDSSKHPFSDLKYFFNGESYVNNLVSKVIEEEGFDYSYDVRLNEYGYPETIYEKLGLINSRIIRYSYVCP
jgi:hypothetical protein